MTEIQPMLVFSVSYLGIFFLLMGAMPLLAPELLYTGKSYMNIQQEEFLSPQDLESIKYLEGINLTFPDSGALINFNPNINVKLFVDWTILSPYISLNHITWELYDGSFPWFFTSLPMYFSNYNKSKTVVDNEQYLGKTKLISQWDTKYNASIFSATKQGLITKCWFTDTNITRNNISDAWDDGEITLSVGFGYDDLTISYSAFNLVGLLLTFQRPDVFGSTGTVAILLNSIIAIPTFLCIAYLIYYFITSIIPFIKGA